MKIKFTISFMAFIGLCLLYSCNQQDNEGVIPLPANDASCKPVLIHFKGGSLHRFTYDQLERFSYGELITVNMRGASKRTFLAGYDDRGALVEIIERQFKDTASLQATFTERIRFEYNGKGQMSAYYYGGDTTGRHLLEFDHHSRLIKVSRPSLHGGGYQINSFDSTGNRVISAMAFHPGGEGETRVHYEDFDNHANPYRQLGIIAHLMGLDGFSVNNYRLQSFFDQAGRLVYLQKFSYGYNQAGYVSSMHYQSFSGEVQLKAGLDAGEYTYSCR